MTKGSSTPSSSGEERVPGGLGVPPSVAGAFAERTRSAAESRLRPVVVRTPTRKSGCTGYASSSPCTRRAATKPRLTRKATPRRSAAYPGNRDCRTASAVSTSQPATHGRGSRLAGAAAAATRQASVPTVARAAARAADGRLAGCGRRSSSSTKAWKTTASATGASAARRVCALRSCASSQAPSAVVPATAATGLAQLRERARAIQAAPAETTQSITARGRGSSPRSSRRPK